MLVLATNAFGLPVLESTILIFGSLGTINVIGVHLLVFLLLLLGELLPILTLLGREAFPLLADCFGQIRLALFLAEAIDCLSLGLLAIFTAFAAEEDEGVLGAFNVVLIALFRSTLDIGAARRLASFLGRC